MSHTKYLINEAIKEVEKSLREKNVRNTEAQNKQNGIVKKIVHIFKGIGVNLFVEKFGIRLIDAQHYYELSSCLLSQSVGYEFIKNILKGTEEFDFIYDKLADDASKVTFDWFIKYRLAYYFSDEETAKYLFAPPITEDYYKNAIKNNLIISNNKIKIDDFNLIKLSKENIVATFIIEQYRYTEIVEPRKGDIILDVGAFFGDTSIWFTKYIGEGGKVFAFEPNKKNLKILHKNIQINLIKNVEVVEAGLSNKDGIAGMTGDKAGATISNISDRNKVRITTIDKFINENKIKKVDFIKMDIEGEEINALIGAKTTISKFKPRLAISVYHKGDDIIKIPEYLMGIVPGYKFYLRHNSTNWAETILYAVI